MESTVQVRQRGTLTLPADLRQNMTSVKGIRSGYSIWMASLF